MRAVRWSVVCQCAYAIWTYRGIYDCCAADTKLRCFPFLRTLSMPLSCLNVRVSGLQRSISEPVGIWGKYVAVVVYFNQGP